MKPLAAYLPTGASRLFRWVARRPVLGSQALGVVLIGLVILLDYRGLLQPIERWFYSERARHFQFFAPAPPDVLVHVDIDDESLRAIGRWPWPRTQLAQIIDELHFAGAKALAMDILLTDAQEPTLQSKPDGKIDIIDHDANLAAALQQFGRVVLAFSFNFDKPETSTPAYSAMVDALRQDPEMTREEVSRRVALGANLVTEDDFIAARREAMSRRIEAECQAGVKPEADLLGRILPKTRSGPGDAARVHEFNNAYQIAVADLAGTRFCLTEPDSAEQKLLPPLLNYTDQLPLIPQFARSVEYGGFVDLTRKEDDPAIRSLPLCVRYRDRIYPQADLAFACAMVDAHLRDVRLAPGKVIIQSKNGRIDIPVHEMASDKFGRIGAYFDIPWTGGRDWKTIYDYPDFKKSKQHIPITLPWELAISRKLIARNTAEANKAIGIFAAEAQLESAKKCLAIPTDMAHFPQRVAAMKALVAEAGDLVAPSLATPEADLKPDEKAFLGAYAAVKSALNEIETDLPLFVRKEGELRDRLKDKAVIIGGTATRLGDVWPTPLHDECPGVVIRGVVVNSIISRHFWYTAPGWVNVLVTGVMGVLTMVVVTRRSPLWGSIMALLLLLFYLGVNGLALFDYGKYLVGVAGPVVAILGVWGGLTLMQLVVEARERARITRRFQSYVDPAIVKYVIEHPELARLEGEVRDMTITFTDLAGFTTMTEALREKAIGLLGRYLGKMVPAIRKNNGLIHRFMGDGIMFSHGAPATNPHMAFDAVNAVIDMHDALARLNEQLAAEGYPPLIMRAGVNTGKVVVGDSGGAEAVEYTCLGDAANLAARLEGANTAMGTSTLISEHTVERLDGQFLLRPIGKVVVMGRSQPVMTYEPLARITEATDAQRKLAELSGVMCEHFLAGQFQECINTADELDAAFGESKLSDQYRKRCHHYLTSPPADFQGVIVLSTK